MTLHFGILLALLCALTTNLGFLFKHRGACAAPDVSLKHPVASAAGLFRSKWFAVGMLVAVGAWFLHVGAMALAPLSLVQAVISGGLVFLTVLAERALPEEELTQDILDQEILTAEMHYDATNEPAAKHAAESAIAQLREAKAALNF